MGEKNEAAVALGKLGGAKGGSARAAKMTPEERSAAAQAAALARWGEDIPKATYQGTLHFGELELPCYVLENGKRVLSQGGMITSLGMKPGSNPKLGGDRLTNFTVGKGVSPFVSDTLSALIRSPLRFRLPTGGLAFAFEATVLVDLCDSVLAARKARALQTQQLHIAERCELIVRGLSRVGIVALVDEATGYQEHRAKDALAKILEQFIAKELRPWVRTFPVDYYKEMFRLRKWNFNAASSAKPALVGKLTNNVVYSRLAPGVLKELRRVTPRDEKGRLKHHLHRKLTEETGHPRLREHLLMVTTLMKASPSWEGFMRGLDRALPKWNSTFSLDLEA